MDNRSDIWHQLRDHETPPPPELFGRLRESLNGGIGGGLVGGGLQRLQRQEIEPPAHLRESITNAIGGSFRKRRLYIYSGIAASLLLLVAGYTVYQSLVGKAVPAGNKQNVVKNVFVTPPARDSIDTTRAATSIAAADLPSVDSISVRHHHSMTANLDGHTIHLVDNDPLFTFTSYHYPEIANYMEEEIRISVDQYTNIVVSKQAALLLKEMYKTRSNGKPTRRARKTKERLEYWKKTDEKRFDNIPSFNPADPLDLAEFIFK